MSFWGAEVKPGKSYHHSFEDGGIKITQATLGSGSSSKKCTLQCSIGNSSPIFLCTLFPEKTESCPLHLEFGDDSQVTFSVIGFRSVHLSGFHTCRTQDSEGDDDSSGEDISEAETEDSYDYDSEGGFDDIFTYDGSGGRFVEDFTDDGGVDMFRLFRSRDSGVVIKEFSDDEKAENASSRPEKLDDQEPQSKRKIIAKSDVDSVTKSEDEDGFPISPPHECNPEIQKDGAEMGLVTAMRAAEKAPRRKKIKKDGDDNVNSSKRKKDALVQNDEVERAKRKMVTKDKCKETASNGGHENKSNALREDDVRHGSTKASKTDHGTVQSLTNDSGLNGHVAVEAESMEEEKKNKKKKKKMARKGLLEGNAEKEQNSTGDVNQYMGMDDKTEPQPSQVRTFANGFVVEELSMGKPDGKKASLGKKVSVKYTGKLKKNGEIFDSNIGSGPFKFRLGVGQVIKGWDVGVLGMRIGDKRRLTIPPPMAYGDKKVGSIPQNAWLIFNVELVDVQ